MAFHVPEKFRIRYGELASDQSYGNNGAFLLNNRKLIVIATDNNDWEHVSVSLSDRCPTWDEMCYVKGIFWDDDDCVIQFHPPKSDYVNLHPYCLHLWRKIGHEFDRPPSILVGPMKIE